MSTKIRVASISSQIDEWDEPLIDNDDSNKIKKIGNSDGEKRKKMDSFLEERRLKQHSVHDYSYDSVSR